MDRHIGILSLMKWLKYKVSFILIEILLRGLLWVPARLLQCLTDDPLKMTVCAPEFIRSPPLQGIKYALIQAEHKGFFLSTHD